VNQLLKKNKSAAATNVLQDVWFIQI